VTYFFPPDARFVAVVERTPYGSLSNLFPFIPFPFLDHPSPCWKVPCSEVLGLEWPFLPRCAKNFPSPADYEYSLFFF